MVMKQWSIGFDGGSKGGFVVGVGRWGGFVDR